MTANYVLLEKITVGAGGASSVTFSGIPQTGYTDLVIKASVRNSSNNAGFALRLGNNTIDSGANYTYKVLYGTGSSVASFSETVAAGYNTYVFCYITPNNATANTFGSTDIYIPNYTSSNQKSISFDSVGEDNATAANSNFVAARWSGTSAINTIQILPDLGGAAGNLAANSTFYLYGVAKLGTTPAIVPYATGGDTIMTDGTYWYHTFLSSGTFTPAKAITCDYLVVAGGGGGGSQGGGGGAGGLRSTVTATGGGGSLESALSLGTSAYTVTVGAGGAGATSGARGTNGSNSVFSTITSTGGGGGGGGSTNNNGNSGGSGGGACVTNASATGGAGTANQGYAGGNNTASPNYGGGGGGGASAVGANGTTTAGGNGGNGVATSISGSSVTYAGGGGAGLYTTPGAGNGGTGGGGAGSGSGSNLPGTNGTANTGGGGGGSGITSYAGGTGGSGIVIVRYLV